MTIICILFYREYLIYLVQDIPQTSNTAGVRLLSVHPGPGVGAAGEVTDTNPGLQSQTGGVCLTAHAGLKALLSLLV